MKKYDITPGVEYVNGKKVGNKTTIDLTDSEALFELSLGRVSPKVKPKGAPQKKPSKSDPAGDEAADVNGL